ncbi:MAG: hypothetical protein R6U37_04265 [Dehalococcoidia bacterium]
MFGFKLCPRCRGDIFLDSDSDGWLLMCLQCGYRKYLGKLGDYHTAREFARSLYRMKSDYASNNENEIAAAERITV